MVERSSDMARDYEVIKEYDRYTIGEYDDGYKAYIINDGICGYYHWPTEAEAQAAADAYNAYDGWEALGQHGYGNDIIDRADEDFDPDDEMFELYRLFGAIENFDVWLNAD
jgi:hypothetical protein